MEFWHILSRGQNLRPTEILARVTQQVSGKGEAWHRSCSCATTPSALPPVVPQQGGLQGGQACSVSSSCTSPLRLLGLHTLN